MAKKLAVLKLIENAILSESSQYGDIKGSHILVEHRFHDVARKVRRKLITDLTNEDQVQLINDLQEEQKRRVNKSLRLTGRN